MFSIPYGAVWLLSSLNVLFIDVFDVYNLCLQFSLQNLLQNLCHTRTNWTTAFLVDDSVQSDNDL